MDYSLPGSSVLGILQARILEWVAISFSRGSFWPRDQSQVSCIAGRCFTVWAATTAAAAAKWLQSCPTLCKPIDGSPRGSLISGILQARTLEWVAISFSNAWKWKIKVKTLSCVWLLVIPWTEAYQAPSMGFSRQEYWSGLPLPSLQDIHSNRQTWLWRTKWSWAMANWSLPRECTGHRKYPFSTTQKMTLHMDVTKWLIVKSNWLHSL